MLALKYLLIAGGLGMILVAVSILEYDVYRELLYRRALASPGPGTAPPLPEWRFIGARSAGLGTDSGSVQQQERREPQLLILLCCLTDPAMRPMLTPVSVIFAPRPRMRFKMSRLLAPSAMRTPISRHCRATK
jgi:hypothetical protein